MQDALVYSFTDPAARIVSKDIKTNVAMNWYFIAASVVVLLPTIHLVTTKLIIPGFISMISGKPYEDTEETSSISHHKRIKHSLGKHKLCSTHRFTIICAIPEHSFYEMRRPKSTHDAPLINGVGLIILVVFLVPGTIYGILWRN